MSITGPAGHIGKIIGPGGAIGRVIGPEGVVWESWVPRTVTLRFTIVASLEGGDATLIGALSGRNTYFTAPVENNRGDFYHAGQTVQTTYGSISSSPTIVVFVEQVLTPTPGVVTIPAGGSYWRWPSRDSDLSILTPETADNYARFADRAFAVAVTSNRTVESGSGRRATTYSPGQVIPPGTLVHQDDGQGDYVFTTVK